MYSVGRKNQQDLLRAELELSRLDDRLIEMERQRARAVRRQRHQLVGAPSAGQVSTNVKHYFVRWYTASPVTGSRSWGNEFISVNNTIIA